MNSETAKAPILIFTYGNPSRGDDGLGPAMFDLLEDFLRKHQTSDKVELLTDYQLQIEHAVDLEHRDCVLFVDASMSASAPFEFQQLQAERDESYSTHAMNPAAVLAVYQQVNRSDHPPAFMLTIRGYEFDLGEGLSEQAEMNLEQAYEFIRELLEIDVENWTEKTIINV